MKKLRFYKTLAVMFAAFTLGQYANAAVSCTACTSDGGLGYSRECCETRVDADGDTYEYCRVDSCLPGQDVPDKLREGQAPGYTRPLSEKYPDAIGVIKFMLSPRVRK